MCIGLVGFSLSFLVTFPKRPHSTYDSLSGGSLTLPLSYPSLCLALSGLTFCGVCLWGSGWNLLLLGFCPFSFLPLLSIASQRRVCAFSSPWGWNEGRGTSSSCEVGPSFRMMALLPVCGAWVGFGGGSLPLPPLSPVRPDDWFRPLLLCWPYLGQRESATLQTGWHDVVVYRRGTSEGEEGPSLAKLRCVGLCDVGYIHSFVALPS